MPQIPQDGCTPLWIACYRGHTRCAELLLNAKADVNVQNKVSS